MAELSIVAKLLFAEGILKAKFGNRLFYPHFPIYSYRMSAFGKNARGFNRNNVRYC